MKLIEIPNNEKVVVTAMAITVRCVECSSTWRLYLNEDGTYPEGWDVCLKCEGKKSSFGYVKEKVNKDGEYRKLF